MGAVWSSGQGYRTCGARTQNGSRNNFLRSQRSLLSQVLLLLLPDQRLHIVPNNICIHTYLTPYRFPSLGTFTSVPGFVISFARPASPYCAEQHLFIHTYLIPYRLYMNYRHYQTTLQPNIFTQIVAVRSVDRIFIGGAPVWR
jgi:hypothetical protein